MKIIKLSLLGFLLTSCQEQVAHKVKITYCDGRPPEIGIVYTYDEYPVDNYDIYNYNTAVPEIGKYLNVCNVEEVK